MQLSNRGAGLLELGGCSLENPQNVQRFENPQVKPNNTASFKQSPGVGGEAFRDHSHEAGSNWIFRRPSLFGPLASGLKTNLLRKLSYYIIIYYRILSSGIYYLYIYIHIFILSYHHILSVYIYPSIYLHYLLSRSAISMSCTPFHFPCSTLPLKVPCP